MHILANQVQENPLSQSTMCHLALPQTIVCFITIKRGCEKRIKKGNISVFGVEWSRGVKWNKFNCSSSCYRDNSFCPFAAHSLYISLLRSSIIEFPCINWFLFVLVRFTNGITRNCFYKYIVPSKNVCTLCNSKFNHFSVCWFTTHRVAVSFPW